MPASGEMMRLMPTRRQVFAPVVFVALTLHVPAAGQGPADERMIREARARSNAAIAAHDVPALAREWMDDVHVLSSTSNQTAGRAANQRRFATQFADRPDTVYVRTPSAIVVYEPWGVAAERGDWTGQWTEPDGAMTIGRTYRAQWRKIDGRWLIQGELYVPTHCRGSRYCSQRP
jgi:ketosteroid isomerase-like protein